MTETKTYVTEEQASAILQHKILSREGYGSVRSTDYDLGSSILKRFVANDPDVVLVEGKEEQIRKSRSETRGSAPSEMPSWSTYDKCIDVALRNDLVHVEVWNGDFLDGYARSIRYKAVFKMRWWELEKFQRVLSEHWYVFVEQKLQEEDEELKRQRLKNKSRELMSKFQNS